MTRVALTGVTGHLGANVVRSLLARGDRVRALVHEGRHGLAGLDLELVPGSILDDAALARCFEGCEAVVHMAALISITGEQGGRVARVNVEGARRAAEAALRAGVERYVHVSSVHAYEHRCDRLLDEGSPRTGPGAPAYDRSKAAGEVAVREVAARGLPVVVVNPTGLVGPHDYRPSRMGRSLMLMARGKLPALTPGGFDFLDVRDAAASTIAALDRGRAGEGYLLGGRWLSVRDIAGMVAASGGAAPPRATVPFAVAWASALAAEAAGWLLGAEPPVTREALHALRHGSRRVSWEKAARELGHRARPFQETVDDTLAFFRASGTLA